MSLLAKIDSTWKAAGVIVAIIVSSVLGWNYTMAKAEETATKATQATINKAMIDGAKEAAAQAVKEQLPAIAKVVAQETAKEVVKQQKEPTKDK